MREIVVMMENEVKKMHEELTILTLALKNCQEGGINEACKLQAKKVIGIIKRLLGDVSEIAYTVIIDISYRNDNPVSGYFFIGDEIEISEDESGLWHITLPTLLPRKKEKNSVDNYGVRYRTPINAAFQEKGIKKKPFLYKRTAVFIIHNFAEDSKLIDYDIGFYAGIFVDTLLEKVDFEEQAYKSCMDHIISSCLI